MENTGVKESVLALLLELGFECQEPEIELTDLGIDSLDLVELQMEAERKFQIVISEAELADLTTVTSLVKLVEGKIRA